MSKDILSMGEAIRFFLDQNGIRDEAEMRGIMADWEKLMGKPIAQHTEKLYFKDGILFVHISSPIWRSELSMAKMRIKTMINTQLNREVVKDVRIS